MWRDVYYCDTGRRMYDREYAGFEVFLQIWMECFFCLLWFDINVRLTLNSTTYARQYAFQLREEVEISLYVPCLRFKLTYGT